MLEGDELIALAVAGCVAILCGIVAVLARLPALGLAALFSGASLLGFAAAMALIGWAA